MVAGLLVNGCLAETLPASDRGLQYGDGLFETIAVVAGRPALWERHLDRLARGCRRLAIPEPAAATLADEATALCDGVDDGVLKLLVTRGSGGRGYAPPRDSEPTRVLSVHPYPSYPSAHWETGVALRVCQQRLGSQPALAGLKHLNRLEQVLARGEWEDPGIAEGVMLSQNGCVVEGTMTNIFAVLNGVALTPPLDDAGVAGIMRAVVMERLRSWGVDVREEPLELPRLAEAEEVFVTNSVIGIWPARSLDGQRLGEPRRAPRLLRELIREGVVPEVKA